MRSSSMPSFNHHTARCDSRAAPVVANGDPLSVRNARGSPYSRKVRSNHGRTPTSVGATINRTGLMGIVFAIWLVQLIVSPLWLRYFLYGPLEWVWRSVTYWHVQSFRRPRGEVPA